MIRAISEAEMRPDLPEAISKDRWYLLCPGCYEEAKAREPEESESVWRVWAIHCFSTRVHQFDGNAERPTISPSLLHTYNYGEERRRYCCHSFVRDGKIQFLSDCTHPLAGRTVDLMDCDLLLRKDGK